MVSTELLPPLPPAEVETSKAAAAESELVAAESGQGGEAVAAPAASGLVEPL